MKFYQQDLTDSQHIVDPHPVLAGETEVWESLVRTAYQPGSSEMNQLLSDTAVHDDTGQWPVYIPISCTCYFLGSSQDKMTIHVSINSKEMLKKILCNATCITKMQ